MKTDQRDMQRILDKQKAEADVIKQLVKKGWDVAEAISMVVF